MRFTDFVNLHTASGDYNGFHIVCVPQPARLIPTGRAAIRLVTVTTGRAVTHSAGNASVHGAGPDPAASKVTTPDPSRPLH